MSFIAKVFALFAVWPAVAEPNVDREYFAQKCAYTTNFSISEQGAAIPVSRTKTKIEDLASINSIIDAWSRTGDDNINRLAFILATARRESSGTWKPIREVPACTSEICREAAIGKLLAKRAAEKGVKPRPNYALPAANGRRYYGRGYIQLTHEAGYRYADKMMGSGTALHNNPDKVMEPSIAASLIVRAMLEGWYGSKKPLSYYLNDKKTDWINARNNVSPRSPHKPITAASAQEIVKCLRTK